jgi:polyhydroxybutyrate depolymerase
MRRPIRIFAVTVFLLTVFSSVALAQRNAGTQQTFTHNGVERGYRVVIPDSLFEVDPEPVPMAIMLHGGGGNARQMANYTRFHEYAPDWIVVYPSAIDENWNDGRFYDSHWGGNPPDDSAFVAALVEEIANTFEVDRDRVYVGGISNGGHMSLRLGCEHSDLFAGIVAVTANLPTELTCEPTHPLSVLVINGTEDPLVPYEGGEVAFNRGSVISTDDTVDFWVDHNRCEAVSIITTWDADPDDETSVEISTYNDCNSDVFVQLYKVVGGGHTWPGTPLYAPERTIGRSSAEFHASEEIVAVFTAPQ